MLREVKASRAFGRKKEWKAWNFYPIQYVVRKSDCINTRSCNKLKHIDYIGSETHQVAQRTNTWFSSWPNIEWLTPQVKSTSISAQQVLADYLTDYGTDLPTRCTDGVWCKKILWVFTKRMKWQHKTAGRRIFKWSPQKDLLMFATHSLLLIAPIFTTEKKQFLFFALDVEMNWLHLCLEKSTTFVNPL